MQVTGHTDPQAAAEAILSRPNTATEWCVVKMGGEGAVLVTKSGEVHHAPAFKVRAAGMRGVELVAFNLLSMADQPCLFGMLSCQQMGRQMASYSALIWHLGLHGGCACSSSILYATCFCLQVALLCCCCQVDVQDTVGCGDSFAAAIAMGFCRTHDVRATLLLANAVGAATATGRGAGTNVARADTVMELLQQAASECSSDAAAHQADVETAIDVLRSSLATMEDEWPAQGIATPGDGSRSSNGNGKHGNGSGLSSSKAPAAQAA